MENQMQQIGLFMAEKFNKVIDLITALQESGYTQQQIQQLIAQAQIQANLYADQKITDLVGLAPEERNTIYELADAIANNVNVIDALNAAITKKADKTTATTTTDGLMSAADKTLLDNTVLIIEQTPGNIILPVDFRQPYAQIKQSLADAALPYFADGSIHTRPLYLKYIWKDDYANHAAKVRNAIVGNPSSNFVDGRELRQIITFNSPVRVSDPEQWDYASKIELTYVSSAVDVRMSAYDPGYKNEVMFLIETDNNNTITGSDDNSLVGGSWTELINALRIGKFPDIHLKTTNSGAFCPATYDFVPIAGTSPVRYTGTIRISYPKDTEQEQQIWFEKIYFEEFYGVGSIYNYVGSQQIEAIQKIPLAPGDIIIPVNFELPYPDLNNTISTAIAPYFADGSIYRSPVYLLYIWKNSYTDPTSIIRNLLVSPSEISSGRIFFNSPQKTKIIGNSSSHAHSFEITKTDDGIETAWDDYIPPAPPKHSTIFLYDNGDHALSISDQIFPGVDLNGWQTLHDEIIAVRPPMVYLRTDNSGAFCPATYSFDPLPDRPTVLVGYVEISYIKKTDTGKQLWIERMEFADFTGDGSLYNVNGSELYDGVTKLPIP